VTVSNAKETLENEFDYGGRILAAAVADDPRLIVTLVCCYDSRDRVGELGAVRKSPQTLKHLSRS
jgi:hypothetical protein